MFNFGSYVFKAPNEYEMNIQLRRPSLGARFPLVRPQFWTVST